MEPPTIKLEPKEEQPEGHVEQEQEQQQANKDQTNEQNDLTENQTVDVKEEKDENEVVKEEAEEEGDEDDEEEEDNIKVTIEDYDFKTIQKQAQPTKQAAPLVLETNQEPIDINQLDDKPWRKPGADINDYFNYGFDETTWRLYCDKQNQMRQIVNELVEPPETFKIPVVHAAPMVQPNVMPYIDERLAHVVMDSRNVPLAQPMAMQMHQPHHQHHNQPHHQHQPASGSGRMKGVEDDLKKYERRHDRSSERRHSSKSRERRHSKSREREREKDKDKDKEKKRERSRSRERRSKETRNRPRSRSREEERRSKRHKSSRHA